jgi:hypothetical protein
MKIYYGHAGCETTFFIVDGMDGGDLEITRAVH